MQWTTSSSPSTKRASPKPSSALAAKSNRKLLPPTASKSWSLAWARCNSQQRLLLVDADDFIFASISDGSITVVARELEGTSNYRTLEEMEEALASDSFWRPHRSYLVNIHHIKEVVPWFKSSYMLKMNDKKHSEIPVSRQQTKRLRE